MADSIEIMQCPACGKDMKKVYISHASCNIDICVNGCGGIFFDNRELKKIDENSENIDEIINELSGKTFSKVDESTTRICPCCGGQMVKNYSSILQNIQVDECNICGGKFLDNGELFKIREEYETEEQRVEDFLKKISPNSFDDLPSSHPSPVKKLFDQVIMSRVKKIF